MIVVGQRWTLALAVFVGMLLGSQLTLLMQSSSADNPLLRAPLPISTPSPEIIMSSFVVTRAPPPPLPSPEALASPEPTMVASLSESMQSPPPPPSPAVLRLSSNRSSPTPEGFCGLSLLQPSAGAVDFWPLELPAFPYERASPSPGLRPQVWRLELCLGGSAASLLPGARGAGAEEAVRRRLLLPTGTHSQCSTTDACTGAIVVTRLVGCPFVGADSGSACVSARLSDGAARPLACGAPPLAGTPSAEAIEDAWELGPDELLVRLEGAEFLALSCLHVGACRYICHFSVTIPGSYRLVVEGLRANWSAIAEAGGYPPLIRDQIAGDRLLIMLGGENAGDAAANEAARATVVAAAQCGKDGVAGSAAGALPTCVDANAPGRWVRTVSADAMFAKSEPWWLPAQREYPSAGQFSNSVGLGTRYFTQLDIELQWLPYACCVRPLAPAVAAACISDGFSVRGDSHSRGFYKHMMRYACGISEAVYKDHKPFTPICLGSENFSATQTCAIFRNAACFEWDPLAEHVPEWKTWESIMPMGHLVINSGQHWPSAWHRTLHSYETHMQNYFSGLAVANPPPGYLIWLETFPFPVRTDAYVRNISDWRTEPRLRLFNAAAERALAPHIAAGKIRVVHVYEKSLPVVDCSHDSAHFDEIAALMKPIIQSFTAAACT